MFDKKKKTKTRRQSDEPELQMTSMIDVVFQLLIFFVVTLKQEDILAQLSVARPAPDDRPPPEKMDDLVTVQVYSKGWVMNGRKVSHDILDKKLQQLAEISRNVTIVIKCTGDSRHEFLVQLLDICAKHQLTNLSVFSM